jgi:predicted molibdopterin-dependent oxidoreductase YjgC
MPRQIVIEINGKAVQVAEGTSVAAALLSTGQMVFRSSITGEPRGPICGMGICFECRVTIDGRPECRSCQVPVRAGMMVATT